MSDKLKEDIILSVLEFLEAHSFIQAKVVLEKESQLRLKSYGKEIDFFHDLIVDG
jgi:hypothetical protein